MPHLIEWLGWLADFLQPQIPESGPALVGALVWSALLEPLKAAAIRRWPLIALIMVAVGYTVLYGGFVVLEHLEDHASGLAALRLALLLSLWLIVSGAISIAMFPIRIKTAFANYWNGRFFFWVSMVVVLPSGAAIWLSGWWFGEGSTIHRISIIPLLGFLMMMGTGMVALGVGFVADKCRTLGIRLWSIIKSRPGPGS